MASLKKKGLVQQREDNPMPPPYLKRCCFGFRPRKPEDFGDGGAFPECHVDQYPLDMGNKDLTLSYDEIVKYSRDKDLVAKVIVMREIMKQNVRIEKARSERELVLSDYDDEYASKVKGKIA